MENENRRKIVALVRENPGILQTDIERRIGTRLEYHLHTLEKYGFLSSTTVSHTRKYFVKVKSIWEMSQAHREVYDVVASKPGVTPVDVSHMLGWSCHRATMYLHDLAENGILYAKPHGRTWRFYPVSTSKQ